MSVSDNLVDTIKKLLTDMGVKAQTPVKKPKTVMSPEAPEFVPPELAKRVWKRNPNYSTNVEACFGKRDHWRNFGKDDLLLEGVKHRHFPTLAHLIPTPAALLFDGHVDARRVGEDEVELTYTYKFVTSESSAAVQYLLSHVRGLDFTPVGPSAKNTMQVDHVAQASTVSQQLASAKAVATPKTSDENLRGNTRFQTAKPDDSSSTVEFQMVDDVYNPPAPRFEGITWDMPGVSVV